MSASRGSAGSAGGSGVGMVPSLPPARPSCHRRSCRANARGRTAVTSANRTVRALAAGALVVSAAATRPTTPRQGHDRVVSSVGPAVQVFSRDGDALAFGTLQDAAGWMQSTDVADGEYEALFTLHGTSVRAGGAVDGPVILTVTELTDLPGLQLRLRRTQQRMGFRSDPDDPRAAANELLRREWELRRPRRPRWLARRQRGTERP